MTVLAVALSLPAGVLSGYLWAVHRTTALVARMTEAELAAFTTAVRERRTPPG